MIKVAYIIKEIKRGGPSKVVFNLIKNLNKDEFDISLITIVNDNDSNAVEDFKKLGIKVVELQNNGRVRFLLFGNSHLKKILKEGNYDIVHSHGFLPDYLISKLKMRAKKITTIHNIMSEDYVYRYGKVKGKLLMYLHRKILGKMDLCIGCSKSVYKTLPKKLKHKTYVQNGCDTKKVNGVVTRDSLMIPQEATVYIYAGGLLPGKNIVYLIESFKKYGKENEYLLVLGKGEELEKCLSLQDEKIKILGFQQDVTAFYKISDVYTSASKSEGFSISILEALAYGLGLFVSNIDSHKEVIENISDFYLGEVFTVNDFVEKWDLFRQKFSKGNRQHIQRAQENNFSGKAMAEKYQLLYKKVYE